MANLKPITIIGGGLAGLTLGIGLRRREVPVTIWEAGHYPRHRVCGEFVSGRGQDVLGRLGLAELFGEAGALSMRTAVFFLGQARSPVRTLTPPALGLARYTMDALLARGFSECGGELRANQRWQSGAAGEGIVRASGRRVQAVENGCRWFGLKIHARNVRLEADLEMHGLAGAYVGLSRLPGDEVNICGLFRSRPGNDPPAGSWPEVLEKAAGTPLAARLAGANFDEDSFCAVAGLSLRPRRAAGYAECRIGDALTMIPPVTGNGMSMAFEAADLAVAPLVAYARGDFSWEEARRQVAAECDQRFARRLAWAKGLQFLMFSLARHPWLAGRVLASSWLWRRLFAYTR